MKKPVHFRDSDLRGMGPSERAKAMADLLLAARTGDPSEHLVLLNRKVEDYERLYETDSETLRREVSAGTRRETWDICKWLMALKRRERLERTIKAQAD